tara:strand:- start:243 stop:1559 length:1317 start_codon:yes stop_codon:yes gene_type:complete
VDLLQEQESKVMSREQTITQYISTLLEKEGERGRFEKEAEKYKPKSGLMSNRNEPKKDGPVDTAPKVMSSADHLFNAVEEMSRYVDDSGSNAITDSISRSVRIPNVPTSIDRRTPLVDLYRLNMGGETEQGFLKAPAAPVAPSIDTKGKGKPSFAQSMINSLRSRYQERRINPNVKPFPEQSSVTVTELDGAAVGGASDGKVDEGLMSRPYDKEAMLDINEPKSVGETFEGIFKFIEKGEGGYEASNRGTQNKKIVGSDLSTIRDGKKLTEMTLGEIKNLQSITSPSNTNRLFAVGRFQMIPDVLKEAQEAVGLPDNTIFDEKTQNILGRYLITDKREKLKDYLAGDRNISTETAMLELAKEFASFPVPKDITIIRGGKDVTIKKGNTYYGDGANKASHKVADVKAMLIDARGGIPIKSGVVDESLRPKTRPTRLASN